MNDDEFKRFRHTDNRVGIDLGVKDFVITSDGEVFENKHFLKRSENKIKKLQQQLSKKVKGSNNRNKARIKLAKAFEHLANHITNNVGFEINKQNLANYMAKVSNILEPIYDKMLNDLLNNQDKVIHSDETTLVVSKKDEENQYVKMH